MSNTLTTPDSINKYGVNLTRFKSILERIRKDLYQYKPKELARLLATLAIEADREAAINTINTLELECTAYLTNPKP